MDDLSWLSYLIQEQKVYFVFVQVHEQEPATKNALKLAVLLVALSASVDAERRRKRQKPQGCSFDENAKRESMQSF